MLVRTRAAIPCGHVQEKKEETMDSIPSLDDVPNTRDLMNRTVVHDDDGLGGRERLHLEDKIQDERSKKVSIEGTLDDHALNDTVVECDRRQDGIPGIVNECLQGCNHTRGDEPFAPREVLFPTGPKPFQRPSPTPQIRPSIARALIDEYQLFGRVVFADAKAVLCAKQLVAFCGVLCDLWKVRSLVNHE